MTDDPVVEARPLTDAELAEAQEWCRQRSLDVPLHAIARARQALDTARDAVPEPSRLADALRRAGFDPTCYAYNEKADFIGAAEHSRSYSDAATDLRAALTSKPEPTTEEGP